MFIIKGLLRHCKENPKDFILSVLFVALLWVLLYGGMLLASII
jgi:hypothetical protein